MTRASSQNVGRILPFLAFKLVYWEPCFGCMYVCMYLCTYPSMWYVQRRSAVLWIRRFSFGFLRLMQFLGLFCCSRLCPSHLRVLSISLFFCSKSTHVCVHASIDFSLMITYDHVFTFVQSKLSGLLYCFTDKWIKLSSMYMYVFSMSANYNFQKYGVFHVFNSGSWNSFPTLCCKSGKL